MRFILWFSAVTLSLVACGDDLVSSDERFFIGEDGTGDRRSGSRSPDPSDDSERGNLVCDPWGPCVPAADPPQAATDAGRRTGRPARLSDAATTRPTSCDPYGGECGEPAARDAGNPEVPCDPYRPSCDDEIEPASPPDASAPDAEDASFDPYTVF